MLDQDGIKALLPPPSTTAPLTAAPTYAPGTIGAGGDRVIFSQTDQLNYNAVTESPAMQASIAALPVPTIAAPPVTYAPVAPVVEEPKSNKYILYIAIFAIVVFCLMLLLFIMSRKGKGRNANNNFGNVPRGFDPYAI